MVILLGKTLDHEMENLKESKPISFIRAISSWNIAEFSYQSHTQKRKKEKKEYIYIYIYIHLYAQNKVK